MKKVFKNLDKPLLLVTILLFVVGLIAVFSSSNVTAYMSHAVSPYNYFLKQLFFLIAGLILFFLMIGMSTKTYGKLSWALLLIVIASLVCLLVIGRAKNQAISWFDLGIISIQPSEFAKVITIIWLARYYDLNSKNLNTYMKSLFPIGICMIICLLIFIQPDLGTTIIYSAIVGAIFFSSPVPKSIKFKIMFLGIGLIIFAALGYKTIGSGVLQDRQNERFNYRNPCKRLLSTGNQVCNGYIAINNGGLTGVGLGNSTQKYLYLPEPYTDFIFAIIVEEMGVLFGIFILLAYMFLLYRILAIGRKIKSNSGAMMCYGIAVYIFLHIAVNLLGLFGLMPMTGVPLPFMSYGGSFTICLIAALTVVQQVNIENKKGTEKTRRRKRRA